MDQIIIKREDPNSGDILWFYVDENGESEEAVLAGVDNESMQIVNNESNSYIIEQHTEGTSIDFTQTDDNIPSKDRWADEEIQRLLTFYNDNKQIFLTGAASRKHIWALACKTMLENKDPLSCETKFNSLKAKYLDLCKNRKNEINNDPFFHLCEQAFNDDQSVTQTTEIEFDENLITFPMKTKQISSNDRGIVAKKINAAKIDEKVQLMLQLYLKYKKSFQKQYFIRNLWETIAVELGEEDGPYWQKRFLNFKQHYVCLLEKRKEGCFDINWPYMHLFDEIFKDDQEFKKKYSTVATTIDAPYSPSSKNDWLETEKIVLMKYYYDCFDDFHNPDIPNSFLWTEVSRLLDKSSEKCKKKFNELKNSHYERYFEGEYLLRNRKPLEILCDNVISKEVKFGISKDECSDYDLWKIEETDELVQFLYDNIEMFKDVTCYFVCWGIIAKKLKKNIVNCRKQWEELVTLYKSILEDKKEDSDLQIDWRYIELFDRIFDYGMDTNLLAGYETLRKNKSQKIEAKKVNVTLANKLENGTDDDELYEDGVASKRLKRSPGDNKAFKILEYYQKNKDKFSTRNKHNLWAPLSRQIGISETQCAHRFRNLKQVYTAYVQREINRPEMPIVWPYYPLCKKVFGYRALKHKLKNAKNDFDFIEWSSSDIKHLIDHFGKNFDDITNNVEDLSRWTQLASRIDKNVVSCKDKFLELRKSYRKLKTQITRNPNVKISWKYFNVFDQIYTTKEGNAQQTPMDVEGLRGSDHDDEDYQCIIVLPEGADISDSYDSSQIIMQVNPESTAESNQINVDPKKWTKRIKKRLLILYINYVRSHKGKDIISKDMWVEISEKLNKTSIACRKMFVKLKRGYKENLSNDNKTETPYDKLLEKVVKLKPKFVKLDTNKTLEEEKVFKNVEMAPDKVVKALQYYLQHVEDFMNPMFEKKFLWTELANYISEPITKVYNKINYLKQAYINDEIDEEMARNVDVLKEIVAKEIAINLVTDIETVSVQVYVERDWSDEEIERLLEWYLSNLDKFKNPKFVRSYLWKEISNILSRSPLDCSKKMSEIRTQYRNMVKENSGELEMWKFYGLCQKIYGTGKKGNVEKVE